MQTLSVGMQRDHKCRCTCACISSWIQKQSKLGDLELKIEELDQKENQEEHEEERAKYEDQKKVILEDIVDTKYVQYEDRIGEELTLSRAIDNIKIFLRFI